MLALIVNPVAGMGGAVGLKGTDDKVDEAIELGARPIAPKRVALFLRSLGKQKILTCPAEMGQAYLDKFGFEYELVAQEKFEYGDNIPKTSKEHTQKYLRAILKKNPKLIVFAGGDGTARDVYEVIGDKMPILGIPCGVKVYSSVFASSPIDAAEIADKFLRGSLETKECEILDIDEEDYRNNVLDTKLFGYAKVPYEPALIPGTKAPTQVTESEDQEGIAKRVAGEMDGKYILGPGTTIGAISKQLGIDYTLLGVDVIEVKNGKPRVLKKDANEKDLLELVDTKTKILVSPIGHQGFIFGRGNQQISARVLGRIPVENVTIVATRSKIEGCNGLRIDVDPEINKKFGDHIQVVVGYHDSQIVKLSGRY